MSLTAGRMASVVLDDDQEATHADSALWPVLRMASLAK